MAHPRRPYLLRIPPELYEAYEAWAADEFRSMNAQLSAVLTDAARRAGRLRRDLPPHPPQTAPDEEEPGLP
jgi:hypothetical protein